MEKFDLDCVELQHQGAAEVLKQLQGLTRAEQLNFWHIQTEQLIARQQAITQKQQQRSRET